MEQREESVSPADTEGPHGRRTCLGCGHQAAPAAPDKGRDFKGPEEAPSPSPATAAPCLSPQRSLPCDTGGHPGDTLVSRVSVADTSSPPLSLTAPTAPVPKAGTGTPGTALRRGPCPAPEDPVHGALLYRSTGRAARLMTLHLLKAAPHSPLAPGPQQVRTCRSLIHSSVPRISTAAPPSPPPGTGPQECVPNLEVPEATG